MGEAHGGGDPPAKGGLGDPREDPESSPSLPSGALAAHAAAAVAPAGRRTNREIWTLAWPVILSQILVSAVSLIDIAMLGRLGPHSLAAVGYATQFYWLSQSVLLAVGIACVALVSQALGAGRAAEARAAFASSLVVALAISVAIAGLGILWPRPLLRLLNAEPAVAAVTVPYLRLTLGATLLLAVAVTYESAFRGAKDTKTPLWIAGFVAVAKTVLNALLIFGLGPFPKLGLVGAGLATIGSQAVAVALFLRAARRSRERRALRLGRRDIARTRAMLGEVFRIASPAVGERLVLNGALMAYFALLGDYGSTAIAAYTVGVRVLSFSWIPATGFAAAAATLVGHAVGAADPREASRAGWRSAGLAVAVSVLLGVLFASARLPLARAFTNDLGVIRELGPFMLILALAQPLLGLHFTLGGALRGAGDTVTPLAAAALGTWGFRVPIAYACASILHTPVVWVWGALVFDHLARAIWLLIAFRSGRWRERAAFGVREAA